MDIENFKKKIKEKTAQSIGFARENWKSLLIAGVAFLALAYLSKENEDENAEYDEEEGREMNFSKKWFKNATDDELDSEREKVRERYVDGTIDIDEADRLYDTLHRFDAEMIDRANLKYEEEHPNAQPRHREHGWYLPNDD